MAPSGGWAVRWARLGGDEALRLQREGWQPFAAFWAPADGAKPAGPILVLRQYRFAGEAV